MEINKMKTNPHVETHKHTYILYKKLHKNKGKKGL